MAYKKDVSVAVEIEYFDPEDDDKWLGSTLFRVAKKGDEPLEVESFRPNIGRDSSLDLVDEMDEMLTESRKMLLEYKDLEKSFGVLKK